MQYAFEVTVEDVVNVMTRMGYVNFERADELHSSLDLDTVESVALYADELDDQTEYAYQEIEKQLRELLKGGSE